MSDQTGGQDGVRDLTPEEVARGLTEGRVVLVDVREPNETAAERFPGAVLLPLSAFDPAAIPSPPGCEDRVRMPLRPPFGRRVTVRAAAGFRLCLPIWPAGTLAWKAAGLPTEP